MSTQPFAPSALLRLVFALACAPTAAACSPPQVSDDAAPPADASPPPADAPTPPRDDGGTDAPVAPDDVPAAPDAPPPPERDGSVAPSSCDAPFDPSPYRGASCFCGADCDCYIGVPYGDARWTAWVNTPGGANTPFTQVMDVYVPRARRMGAAAPLILRAHANGETRAVVPTQGLATDLLLPALREGMVVASLDFRHPVDQVDLGAPRTDIARGVQFLRCHAAAFGIDRARVGATGLSRGTLAVWTAVQNDLADPMSPDPVLRQSSRMAGVWAVQAQTSYWGEWIADTFFDAASRDFVLMSTPAANLGHAVGDVTADDPPIAVTYDSALQPLPLRAAQCMQLGGPVNCTHLPNFGDELCRAYAAVGRAANCTVAYSVRDAGWYDSSLAFFHRVFGL